MGWCSGTYIFDMVAESLLSDNPVDKKEVLTRLANALEDQDWDCHGESQYWDHPLVKEIFVELHPDWVDDYDD